FEIVGDFHARVGASTRQLPHHEQAAEDLESRIAKDAGVRARGMKQQLRLDAVQRWRVEQRFKEMLEQRVFHFVRRIGAKRNVRSRLGQGEYIADHGLRLLINAEDVAG